MCEYIFPGPNNAFGGVTNVILPCSQRALLLVIRRNMAIYSISRFDKYIWICFGSPIDSSFFRIIPDLF